MATRKKTFSYVLSVQMQRLRGRLDPDLVQAWDKIVAGSSFYAPHSVAAGAPLAPVLVKDDIANDATSGDDRSQHSSQPASEAGDSTDKSYTPDTIASQQ